jgi:hypothetical protein
MAESTESAKVFLFGGYIQTGMIPFEGEMGSLGKVRWYSLVVKMTKRVHIHPSRRAVSPRIRPLIISKPLIHSLLDSKGNALIATLRVHSIES